MSNGYCKLSFMGKFKLPRKFICEVPDIAHVLLSQGIIVRAEALFHEDSIEYMMYSPALFRELSEGEEVPMYIVDIDSFVNESNEEVGYEFHATELR